MKRALSSVVVMVGLSALLSSCEMVDSAAAAPEKAALAPLPYQRIEPGKTDPAQNGPGNDMVIDGVQGERRNVKFPHFTHASSEKSGLGIPCVACHHMAEDKEPEEGCSGCHKPPTKDSEEAHRGPDDNMLLASQGRNRSAFLPVPFNHFSHTSLIGYKLGCTCCHHTGDMGPCADCHEAVAKKTDKGEIAPKLKRAFHLKCKGCHRNLKKNRPDSIAPTECDSCHTERRPARLPGGLSLERAFHLSCVSCHQKVAMARADAKAPADCEGCHESTAKSALPTKTEDEGPVKIATVSDDIDKGRETMLIDHAKEAKKGTHFNHHVHQQRASTCNKCHHKGLKDPTCRTCHKEPDNAKKAYHKVCIGCHKERNGPVKCAACHP